MECCGAVCPAAVRLSHLSLVWLSVCLSLSLSHSLAVPPPPTHPPTLHPPPHFISLCLGCCFVYCVFNDTNLCCEKVEWNKHLQSSRGLGYCFVTENKDLYKYTECICTNGLLVRRQCTRVSLSTFPACCQCWGALSSLISDFNFEALAGDIYWFSWARH